nr:aminotransferase class I/II-fold pyridoxal phosphate-dependent enzyme [Streptomyces sp. GESEQ-35]
MRTSVRHRLRAASRAGPLRCWTTAYLCVMFLLAVAYYTWPSWHVVIWAALGVVGVTAILLGVHLHRPAKRWPWFLLASANFTFVAGDTVYNVIEGYLHQPKPFPSAADACYLATYPLFAAGIFGFIRARGHGRDFAVALDALILTSGLALLSWAHLITPLTALTGLTWVERAISIAYPLGDVLMLAMLARLLTPGGLRSRSVQLLTVGTVAMLTSDVVYGMLQLRGTWQVGTPIDLGWGLFFTAWGLAALHPSMVGLTERVPEPAPGIAERRLVLLAAASLIAPALLVYRTLRGWPQGVAVISIFSGIMFLLVLARLWVMMTEHRKAEARERSLRVAAASLVAALGPREVASAVEEAAAMFGAGMQQQTLLLVRDHRKRLQAIPTSCHPWLYDVAEASRTPDTQLPELLAHGRRLVTADALDPAVAAALGPATHALLCPLALQAPAAGEPLLGVLLLGGPEKKLREISGPAQSLASQAALALERFGLSEEVNRRTSEAYFRTLVHNTSDVILILDDDDTVRYASPSADTMFGYALVPGTPLLTLLAPSDADRVRRALARMRAGNDAPTLNDWRVLRGDMGHLDIEARCSDLRDEPTVHGLVLTLRDVTEQRQLERELTHRAFHDSLTGLPNRVLLLERIERALLRGRRESTLPCVLFADLDDFKVVNDTMGHSVGDELLVEVAKRLGAALRLSDTAARLGGDEFAILIEGAREPSDAEALAAQIVRRLNQPFHLTDGSVRVSTSVGVATALDSADAEEFLAHADLALYAAKTDGKRRWRRYHPDLQSGLVAEHELQAGLDAALNDHSFALRYQPIVDVGSGAIAGFEALIRWPHGQRGMVLPGQFITLAEETGHIIPLGAWVLERAAADVSRWQREMPHRPPLRVNVNVSARQFRDPGILDEVRSALGTSGLAPGSLVMELTETVLMRQDDQIRATMSALKDLGVSIAIDDFGTGFSSLSYLRDFPIDMLKVDKSFIDNITTDPQQVALVEGIVRIADVLGLQVVAEGIETHRQRELLAAMGCRYGQGYLFARPMTAEQATTYLYRDQEGRAPLASRSVGRPRQHRHVGRRSSGSGDMRRHPRWRELERLKHDTRMCDAVIDEVRGRKIRCGDHWLVDFASCNYLGFDLEPEIMDAIGPQVRRWGTHPSWSRLIGSPHLYPQIEERLTDLLGAPETLVLPTITLIHQSVIPLLAEGGHVFVEATAHRTIYEGCVAARGQGTTVQRFHADRPDELDTLLRAVPGDAPRLVCMDGVNSMTGNFPDLRELASSCRDRGALLYVDDAHGFGVIGERSPAETSPYGSRGNSIVRHLGESYDGIVLVGGFSKAYSSLLAFLAVPKGLKDHLKVAAAPYLYSGPSPTASLATVLAGFDVNARRGDAIRGDLYRKTARVLEHVRGLGIATPNADGLPIVEIPLAQAKDLESVAAFLWDRGIYVTLAAYPLVPRGRVGFRIQITASNTDQEIEQLTDTLTGLAQRFDLQRRDGAAQPGAVADDIPRTNP